jgi:hypothetical protein
MSDNDGRITDLDFDVRRTVRMTIDFMEIRRNRAALGTSYVPRNTRRWPY